MENKQRPPKTTKPTQNTSAFAPGACLGGAPRAADVDGTAAQLAAPGAAEAEGEPGEGALFFFLGEFLVRVKWCQVFFLKLLVWYRVGVGVYGRFVDSSWK